VPQGHAAGLRVAHVLALVTVCESGFNSCLVCLQERRVTPRLATPSHASSYRMATPDDRARGHVHACGLKLSAPQCKDKAWPLASRATHYAARRRTRAPCLTTPHANRSGPSRNLGRVCVLVVALAPHPWAYLTAGHRETPLDCASPPQNTASILVHDVASSGCISKPSLVQGLDLDFLVQKLQSRLSMGFSPSRPDGARRFPSSVVR
jgi:hypothetical protein